MIRSPHRFSRRALLGGLGAGIAGLPFLPLLNRPAEAQDDYPTRLLLVLGPLNGLQRGWEPPTTGELGELGSRLAPLERHKDQLLILSGIEGAVRGFVGGHKQGMVGMWTGSSLGPDEWPLSHSIDQEIMRQHGSATPFPTVEFGVMSDLGRQDAVSRMIYGPGGSPIVPESSPYRMFDRLFGSPADSADQERIRREQRSVLDAVGGSLEQLQSRVSVEDRTKLDAHFEAIRSIERRLDGSDLTPVGAACATPTLSDSRLDLLANDNFPAIYRLQTDLLVAALACDRTRIASFQPSISISTLRFHWIEGITGQFHFDVMHGSSEEQRIATNLWFVEQFAYLLDALRAVPEGGGTLLDHTVVVWAGEMAEGNHGNYPTPHIIAGGGNRVFRLGQHLAFERQRQTRVLHAILQAFDSEVDRFGNYDDGLGPLSGLT
ncbi:MAG: DUF1552 domain-containing protein [Myxococcota bacterium]